MDLRGEHTPSSYVMKWQYSVGHDCRYLKQHVRFRIGQLWPFSFHRSANNNKKAGIDLVSSHSLCTYIILLNSSNSSIHSNTFLMFSLINIIYQQQNFLPATISLDPFHLYLFVNIKYIALLLKYMCKLLLEI